MTRDRAKTDRHRVERGWRQRGPVPAARRRARNHGAVEAEISPVWETTPQLGSLSHAPGYDVLLRREAIFRRSLGIGDVLAGYLALAFAVGVVSGPAKRLAPAAVLLAPFIVVVTKALGLYDRDQHRLRKTTLDEVPALLQLAVFYAGAVWLVQGVVAGGQFARAQVFALALSMFVLDIVCRGIVRALALRACSPERCVVVGSAAEARRTAAKVAASSGVKAELVGRVALDEGDSEDGSLGDLRSLAHVIEEHAIERVIIAPDGHDQDEVLQCIRLVKALGMRVSVVPRLLEVVGSSSVFDDVDGIPLLGVRQYGLSKSSEFLKRVTDIVVATTVLIVLAPLIAILSLAISLDSRGSPLFWQARIGRRGERFSMLKFRSMFIGADDVKDQLRALNEAEGGLFKIADDPRVTRVGRFLRRTSLDELPQLVNVLKGEMSLVGPRPLVADEVALLEGWQRRRLAVKPGMTGLWQIFGSARIPLSEMVKIDYLYGANWSIWLDLKILIRTVPYVLGRRGV